MKKNYILKTMLGAFLLSLPGVVSAAPANTALRQHVQPDGTVIMVRTVGDEFSHATYSEDGKLLMMAEDGSYVYAQLSSEGIPAPSNLLARPAAMRSAADKALLAKMDDATVKKAILRRDEMRRSQENARNTRAPGICGGISFKAMGEKKALVLLVEFKDRKFTDAIPDANKYFTDMLNEEGYKRYGGKGSARDFFIESSNGAFVPQFDVLGPVTLPYNYKYYGENNSVGNEPNAYLVAVDACDILDPEVDFSQYDTDGDGDIDDVFIYFAGRGENDGGDVNTIWPHSFDVTKCTSENFYYDGVRLDHYACCSELASTSNMPTGIGVFIHEFSHVIGLPDLYVTNGGTDYTVGEWSCLDRGLYLNGGNSPTTYGSYERYCLDWMQPEYLTHSGDYELEALTSSNKAYMVEHPNDRGEYFLFENRQNEKFDTYIPSHGMLVWHVKFETKPWSSNTVNNDRTRQLVDLVEADGLQTLQTTDGDPFPGSTGNTSFTFTSKPAFKFMEANAPRPIAEITNIREENGKIYFHAEVDESSVESVATEASAKAFVEGGVLYFTGENATVYDAMGRMAGYVSANAPLTLDGAGMYLVRTADKTYKVLSK